MTITDLIARLQTLLKQGVSPNAEIEIMVPENEGPELPAVFELTVVTGNKVRIEAI